MFAFAAAYRSRIEIYASVLRLMRPRNTAKPPASRISPVIPDDGSSSGAVAGGPPSGIHGPGVTAEATLAPVNIKTAKNILLGIVDPHELEKHNVC